jgi:hypothetical protein
MTPDLTNLREGDRIRLTVEGVFVRIHDNDDFAVTLDGSTWMTYFESSEIEAAEIEVLAKLISVADRVTSPDGSTGVVEAVVKDQAWVLWDETGDDRVLNEIVPLKMLERL